MKYILSIIIFAISFLSTVALTPEPQVIVGPQGERGEQGEQGILGVSIPSGTALFETSLQAPITKTATAMTLKSGSVSGGNTLSGYQCFTIDEGSAQAEFVCGTVSGTAVSSMIRGVDPITATSTNSTLQFAHRRGANVKITDFPLIQVMRNIINGNENFPNALTFDGKLTYSTTPSITNVLDIITKDYADAIANQGAATATADVAGIAEEATAIEAASSTTYGATRPLFLTTDYATTSPDTTTSPLIVMAKVGGKIKQAWLDLTADWTFSGLFTATGTSTLATTTVTQLTVSGDIYNDTNLVSLVASTTMTGATLPQPVYIATSTHADAGGILLCDSNVQSALDFIGFVVSNSATGTSAYVQTDGIVDGFSSLTKGSPYYVQDAVGTIGISMGTYEVLVGTAISATEILIEKGKDEYMGTISIVNNDSSAVPSEAKKLIIAATLTGESGAGGTETRITADITLTKKGRTVGTLMSRPYKPSHAGPISTITFTWSGDTITASNGNLTGNATVYMYR